jgi:hypothetical protein
MSSTLVITPLAGATKGARAVGTVAVRETVAVTLIGLGSRVGEGLVLRVLHHSTVVAVAQNWTASGTAGADASGALNLNTVELVAAMAGRRQGVVRWFNATLWSVVAQELVAGFGFAIKQNLMVGDESLPQPLVPWGRDLSSVREEVLADITVSESAWTLAAGDEQRELPAEPTYGQVIAALRTMASDLQGRGLL